MYYLKLTNNLNQNQIYFKDLSYFSSLIKSSHSINLSSKPINSKKLTTKNKIRLLYKRLKNFFLVNTPLVIFSKKKKFMLIESDSSYTIEFLKKSKALTIPLSLTKILSENYFKVKLSENQIKACDDLSEQISTSFLVLLKNHHINDKSLGLLLKKHYSLIFQKTLISKIVFDNYLHKKKPIDLYIGSNNNSLLRTFTSSVMSRGGQVSVFTHGEPIIYDWDKISWMELTLSNNYYEYSNSLANSLKNANEKQNLLNSNCQIKSFDTKQFIEIRKNNNNVDNINPNSVMFLANEYVRDGQLSQVSSFTNIIQYEFELKILKFLSTIFKRVYYKRHPGGVFSEKKINFFPENIIIINEPYESVQNLSQTIIFGHSKTTAIGHALSTKKNIILFTGSWEVFEENVFKSLNKQVHLLSFIESGGFLDFNKTDLLHAIKNPKNNYSYYNNFLAN